MVGSKITNSAWYLLCNADQKRYLEKNGASCNVTLAGELICDFSVQMR